MAWPLEVGAGLLPVVGVAAVVAYGCAAPSSQLLGPAMVRGPAGNRRIALTFDDGPAEPYTGQILDILRDAKARATFFVCGKNVARLPDVTRRIRAEGHALGNHTFTHPFLYFKRRVFMADEIDRTQEAIERVAGVRPKLFRPPYGVRWFGLFRLLHERGMHLVQWSNAGFDWRERMTAEGIVGAVLRNLEDGAIILLHDGREARYPEEVDASTTVGALPAIIEGVRKAGFEFAMVEDFIS